MTCAARAIRVGISLAVIALITAGTLWGDDDHFPFGPFRMYSTTSRLDAPVASTRLEALREDGTKFVIRDGNTGFRRAELEGQMKRFLENPELLGALAEAYELRNPGKQQLRRIDVVVRRYALADGSPTGEARDEVVVSWTNPEGTE